MLLVELEEQLEVLLVELEEQLEVCDPGWCSTSQARPGNACSSSSPTHRTPWPWGRDAISELDSSRVRIATLGTLDMSSPWLQGFLGRSCLCAIERQNGLSQSAHRLPVRRKPAEKAGISRSS